MDNNEQWKQIPEFPAYEASTLGRIRNKSTGRVMKPGRTGKDRNYLAVSLRRDGRSIYTTVGYLVLTTFVGPRADKMEVHHGKEGTFNNSLSNIRWVTRSENLKLAHEDGLRSSVGERNGRSKVDEDTVRLIRERYKKGETQTAIAAELGMTQGAIGHMIRKHTWKTVD